MLWCGAMPVFSVGETLRHSVHPEATEVARWATDLKGELGTSCDAFSVPRLRHCLPGLGRW